MPRPGHATLATAPVPWGAALAAVVHYFVVLPVSKLIEQFSPQPAAATRACPFWLSKIPLKARRYAFCTSDVEDKVQALIDLMTSA